MWWLLFAGVVMLAPGWSPAVAADVEVREFNVFVDGKRGGHYVLSITRHDDANLAVSAEANVSLSFAWGLKKYTYTLRATEEWKDGRLVRLDSSCNDDGSKFAVAAEAEGNGLRVKVNGQGHISPADVWTTTYWRLPDAKFRNHGVPLLDVDTGKDINGTMQYVGVSRINVNGELKNCAHYRVSGGVQADLWFDDQERLVRNEGLDDGHRTLLELARVRR
jgi:hypothetical protein